MNSHSNNAKRNRIKVFDNPILEFLTKTHIAFPLTIFPILSVGMVAMAYFKFDLNSSLIITLFIASFLFFTLFEYVIHRNVFHWTPDSPFKKWIQFNFHGVHHLEPKDKKRLAMPIVISVILTLSFLGLTYITFGALGFAVTPGFITGYTGYLAIHYMVHTYAPPKNGPFKILWINHAIHHYKDDSVAFGVSSPLWDLVFGTLPERKKIR